MFTGLRAPIQLQDADADNDDTDAADATKHVRANPSDLIFVRSITSSACVKFSPVG